MHLSIRVDDQEVAREQLRDGDDPFNRDAEEGAFTTAYEYATAKPGSVVAIVVDVNEEPDVTQQREVLVHLNLALAVDDPATPQEIEREIQGALEVGTDDEQTPVLSRGELVVALVDPI